MSFILDALKKSESDRQRNTGPALFEVKIAPPKARFPIWAIALIVLLVVNSIIVGWLLLRRGSHADESAAATTAAAVAPNAGTAAAVPAPAPPAPAPVAQLTTNPPASAPVTSAPPPVQTTAAVGAAGIPVSPQTTAGGMQQPAPAQGQGFSNMDVNEPTLAGNNRSAGGADSPDDLAPATEASSSPFKGHVKRGTESGYVLYQDAALVPGSNLPQLRLDLHVYAAKPQDRFALINMRRMHEGDATAEGVRVVNITPEGVVMSHNGQTFLLPRD
jgi:general secretion pathway protein B